MVPAGSPSVNDPLVPSGDTVWFTKAYKRRMACVGAYADSMGGGGCVSNAGDGAREPGVLYQWQVRGITGRIALDPAWGSRASIKGVDRTFRSTLAVAAQREFFQSVDREFSNRLPNTKVTFDDGLRPPTEHTFTGSAPAITKKTAARALEKTTTVYICARTVALITFIQKLCLVFILNMLLIHKTIPNFYTNFVNQKSLLLIT